MDTDLNIKPSTPAGAIRRVLVVDDSHLQRSILAATMRFYGFEVHEAASGAEALQLCKTAFPDLVLSDWIMPEMNGLEFCKAFRTQSDEAYGYFILMTTKTEKEHVVRGLEVGADDFLLKPINTPELLARITAGDRILRMQRELSEKNRVIADTLIELQRVHDLLDQDLYEAKKLQQSLIRDRYVRWPAAALSLMMHPCGHVGGDLVGHYPIDKSRIGIFAIDVSGHGVSSALMTARLAGYLSAAVPDQNVALCSLEEGEYTSVAPAQVLADLNALFLEEIETELYFTMILAEINLETGKVLVAQAGHPHPIVQRANGAIEQAGTGGVPIGLVAEASYVQFEIHLAAGDRLLILSDGVTECMNPCGEMVLQDELVKILELASGQSGESYLEALVWYLREFAGEGAFADDISGVMLEYFGSATS